MRAELQALPAHRELFSVGRRSVAPTVRAALYPHVDRLYRTQLSLDRPSADLFLCHVLRPDKAAVIFGPNGSGKSNFINAMSVMRDLVLHSTSLTSAEFAARHTPFRFGLSDGHPTEFSIDVLLGTTRYLYSFAYNHEHICSERLMVYCTGKSQRWFERSIDGVTRDETWAPFSQKFNGPRAMWRSATRAESLFLTAAAGLNSSQLEPLFRWFEQGMQFVLPSDPLKFTGIGQSMQNSQYKGRLLGFLQSAGIRVHDVRACGPQSAGIEVSHARENRSPVWTNLADESAGTQRLVSLFAPLSAAVERRQLLLADEFDLGLHPLVARYLIGLINGSDAPPQGAQMVLTSQNTSLMDMQILRRDEIWLMEQNASGASELVRVWRARIPPRKGELIGRRYLCGRYGAIPHISTRSHADRSDHHPHFAGAPGADGPGKVN